MTYDNNVAIRVPFDTGWKFFCDLAVLVGGHRAQLALNNCADICQRNVEMVRAQAARISASSYINPNDIAGVDLLVEALALELLKTMIMNGCLPDDGLLKWEIVHIGSYKLTVKPKYGAKPGHDLLGIPHVL